MSVRVPPVQQGLPVQALADLVQQVARRRLGLSCLCFLPGLDDEPCVYYLYGTCDADGTCGTCDADGTY